MIIRLVWDFEKLSGALVVSNDDVPIKMVYDLSSDDYWAIKESVHLEDNIIEMHENSKREMNTYTINEKTYALLLLRLP